MELFIVVTKVMLLFYDVLIDILGEINFAETCTPPFESYLDDLLADWTSFFVLEPMIDAIRVIHVTAWLEFL